MCLRLRFSSPPTATTQMLQSMRSFLTCNLLPLLILLQVESVRAAASGAVYRFALLAAIFAALMGAVLITSYYVSFFFILADILVLILYVFILRPQSPAL